MVGAHQMRQDLRNVVAQVVPERLRRKIRLSRRRTPAPGLPPGLDPSVLEELVQDVRDTEVVAVRHLQLSGWRKPSAGTFRVFVDTPEGEWSVVFKEAVITDEETPGLGGLPVRPGAAEYRIYLSADDGLAVHLPTAYRIEEIEPHGHYRFLLEDLARRGYEAAFPDDAILHVAGLLPRLHADLSANPTMADAGEFVSYDRDLSAELRRGARRAAETYVERTADRAVQRVLERWSQVERAHDLSDAYEPSLRVLRHGDANRANALVSAGSEQKVKLVDWEWAGWALPHADLADLLKGKPTPLVERALERFASERRDLGLEDHRRLHLWARVEMRLFDLAFLIPQHLMLPGTARMDLPRYIHVSARELDGAVRSLVG